MEVAGSEVRPMQAYDIPAVCSLESTIFQYADQSGFQRQKQELLRQFLTWQGHGASVCEVIEANHSLLAYHVLLLRDDLINRFWTVPQSLSNQVGYLAQIAVSPELQGQGLGQALLNRIEALCQFHQKTVLRLEVAKDNPASQWYLKRDFIPVGAQLYLEKSLGSG